MLAARRLFRYVDSGSVRAVSEKKPAGFRAYYASGSAAPLATPFTEIVFMVIVTLLLVVGLPAAIAGIFYGIGRLGASWGGGH